MQELKNKAVSILLFTVTSPAMYLADKTTYLSGNVTKASPLKTNFGNLWYCDVTKLEKATGSTTLCIKK